MVFRDCTHADSLVRNDFHRFVGKTARSVGNDYWGFLLAGGELDRLAVACPCLIGGVGTDDVSGVCRQFFQLCGELVVEGHHDLVVNSWLAGVLHVHGIGKPTYRRFVAAIIQNGGCECGAVFGHLSCFGNA